MRAYERFLKYAKINTESAEGTGTSPSTARQWDLANVLMDELKELDCKVKRPANVFAYIFGTLSAIIMGSGMSLVMTDIGTTVGITEPMLPGIVIGIVGMFMAIINYPIYKGILGARRKKYADKIIAISDKIMKG